MNVAGNAARNVTDTAVGQHDNLQGTSAHNMGIVPTLHVTDSTIAPPPKPTIFFVGERFMAAPR